MVRSYWLAVTFGAGIALGLLLGRGVQSESHDERVEAKEPRLVMRVPAARAVDPEPAPSVQAAPVLPPAVPGGPKQAASPPPASVTFNIENAEPEHVDYDNYSGYSLPVDAGPTFGPEIADRNRN